MSVSILLLGLLVCVAGCGCVYLLMRRAMRAEIARLQCHISSLEEQLRASSLAGEVAAPPSSTADVVPSEMSEKIPAETMAVISAAVTTFMGKRVTVHSAQALKGGTAWVQQGRVNVQTSHNLAHKSTPAA